MSPDAAGGRVLVVYTEDGTCFEIPRDVVEKGRVEGERLAELHRLVEAGGNLPEAVFGALLAAGGRRHQRGEDSKEDHCSDGAHYDPWFTKIHRHRSATRD